VGALPDGRTNTAPRLGGARRAAWPLCQHGRGHIIRAILEGVAFSLKDSLTIFAEIGVPVNDIRLGGGGALSRFGVRSRPTFTQSLSRSLWLNRARRMAQRFLPEWAGLWASVDDACSRFVRVASVVDPVKQSSDKLQSNTSFIGRFTRR